MLLQPQQRQLYFQRQDQACVVLVLVESRRSILSLAL